MRINSTFKILFHLATEVLNPLAAFREDVVIRESIVLKTNIEHQLFFKSIHKIRALSGDHITNHKNKQD